MSDTEGPPLKQLSLLADEEEDDDIDETLSERLLGLTEMFPDPIRNGCGALTDFTWGATKFCVSYGRSAVWFFASTATILFLPALIEREQVQLMEAKLQQERQMLLGPNAAVSGQQGSGMVKTMMPGMPGMPPQ